MEPIVLILSYGSIKPIEIVKKLRALRNVSSGSEKVQEIECEEKSFPTYPFNIKNKYFETSVNLLPYTEPLNTLPEKILKATEALFVLFDSSDKSFLTHIPKLCELVEQQNIELGLLITTQLYDDCNLGLSYADVKDSCKTAFDVVEFLCKDEDNAETETELEDFNEILEALENHVWSNVNSAGESKKHTTAEGNDDFDEEQLEAYENLLTNIVNFKNNSSNLNRDQVLDQAEKLAELFAGFMGDD